MAERKRFTLREILIGIVVLLVVFVVLYLIAGALNLAVPSWLIGGIGGAIGVLIWFRVIGRTGAAK